MCCRFRETHTFYGNVCFTSPPRDAAPPPPYLRCTGGAPEGVVVAAALSCFGGQIQGRLVLDDDEKIRAKRLGITDFTKKYNIDDMVKGDIIFCATGVTSGDLAEGVKDLGNEYEVNSFILHKSQNIIKSVKNIYNK